MRITASAQRDFRVRAISGIRTILLALNCPPERRKGLLGFAIQKEQVGGTRGPQWLRSLKVFPSVVPDPKHATDPADPTRQRAFYTNEFPVQSFLWGDYGADPGARYRFRVLPMYGAAGALTTDPADEIAFEITAEEEWSPNAKHGVWFNRGAIASQKFAEEFKNEPPGNIDDPKDETVAWLSRGLLEACLAFINETKPNDALRVAAYEFTYAPILKALKALIDKGIDVKIVYHDTTGEKGKPNETAMAAAGLPIDDQKRTFRRSKPKIPHNKFIVRLRGGTEPTEVWTGSTNFTPSGFLGQTNVGHRIRDAGTAKQYLKYWEIVRKDPDLAVARAGVEKLTPDLKEILAKKSVTRLFSPRAKSLTLDWYGRRMVDAVSSVWFTAAFGITQKLQPSILARRNAMRFVLMEKPAPVALGKEMKKDITHLIVSFGVPLGELYEMKDGKPTARRRIKEFELDKWFFKEEHFRRANEGFVFFVHTKFLLIDPLSDDPLVCSGSANFSPDSLLQNDENMLVIRGDTRVADIYMTEFDRVFRHFYFRNVANELAAADSSTEAKSAFLDETDGWTNSYFKPGTVKSNRRELFFAQATQTWAGNAAARAGKVPAKKAPAKKAPAKKAPAKKAPAKKASAKKVAAKKAAPKKKSSRSKRGG